MTLLRSYPCVVSCTIFALHRGPSFQLTRSRYRGPIPCPTCNLANMPLAACHAYGRKPHRDFTGTRNVRLKVMIAVHALFDVTRKLSSCAAWLAQGRTSGFGSTLSSFKRDVPSPAPPQLYNSCSATLRRSGTYVRHQRGAWSLAQGARWRSLENDSIIRL